MHALNLEKNTVKAQIQLKALRVTGEKLGKKVNSHDALAVERVNYLLVRIPVSLIVLILNHFLINSGYCGRFDQLFCEAQESNRISSGIDPLAHHSKQTTVRHQPCPL